MIVRIRGVKTVRSKGRLYYYHRKTMTRLPDKPGSAAFLARVEALERRAEPAPPRTLGALTDAYRASPEFLGLAIGSKGVYELVFTRLRPNARVPVAAIDTAMIYELRDKLAAERTWSFANRTVKVLRLLFEWGRKRGHCKGNPAADVDLIRRPKGLPERNRPWTSAELEAVLQAAPEWLRVPIAIGAYTGLREGDVARVTWAAYDGQTFRARSQKTGVPTLVAVHYRLREMLDAAPRTSPNICLNAKGQPMTRPALCQAFFRLVRSLGLNVTFHGLRHTLGSEIVELGGTNEEAAAVLGHLSTRTTAHYSRHASRDRLAARAIERLENASRKTDLEKRKTRRVTS